MSTECCDVIVAHSPPIFTGHRSSQPNLQSSVCIYKNLRLAVTQKPSQKSSPVPVRRYVSTNSRGSTTMSPTRSADNKFPQSGQQGSSQTPKPRRPCLVIRTDSEGSIGSSSSSGSSSDENEPSSPIRRKKKVVFADDRGLSLTQVRLMNEPSNQPPKLLTVCQYLNPLAAVTAAGAGGAANKHAGGVQLWHLRFPQPASNYLDFRRRLDTSNISLENVIVKSPEHRIVGTVKVRNLSYNKEVFVRCTEDKWAAHRDAACTYVHQNTAVNANGSCSVAPAPAPVQNIYDTFTFCLELPSNANAMEFAVCYRCADFEYWDNNDGNNYCVSASGPPPQQTQEPNTTPAVSRLPPAAVSRLPAAAAAGVNPTAEYDHRQMLPVHFFGAQSKQNLWTSWREQKNDTTAYW